MFILLSIYIYSIRVYMSISLMKFLCLISWWSLWSSSLYLDDS